MRVSGLALIMESCAGWTDIWFE